MARPVKDGLEYFPMDVNIFSDTKIKVLRVNYGTEGAALYVYVLCEIYRSGWFVKSDRDFIDCAAGDLGIPSGKIPEIIGFCCDRGLFSKEIFEKFSVLTSPGVQKRFQEVRKGCKRNIFVDCRFWLLSPEETYGYILPVDENGNVPENYNSRKNTADDEGFSEKNSTKKRKENESKENERKEEGAAARLFPSDTASPRPLCENNTLSDSSTDAASPEAPAKSTVEENSATLTEDSHGENSPALREILTEKYGSEKVAVYEEKSRAWCARKGIPAIDNPYPTIARWMEQDRVPTLSEKHPAAETPPNSSFTVEDIMDRIKAQYAGS